MSLQPFPRGFVEQLKKYYVEWHQSLTTYPHQSAETLDGLPAASVESETAFGQAPAVGTATTFARGDHTHGTPADPGGGVTDHGSLTGVTPAQHHDVVTASGAHTMATQDITAVAASTTLAAHIEIATDAEVLTGTDTARAVTPAGLKNSHTDQSDPHTGYRLESADHTHASSGLQGGQITDSALSAAVGISKGGTGQTTAQAAIDALTQVSSATNEHVLTKDTATGNAKWKPAAGGSSDPAALIIPLDIPMLSGAVDVLTLDNTTQTETTTGEKTIFSYSVPANRLGATGGLRLNMAGTFVRDHTSGTLTWKVKFGATTVLTSTAMTLADSSNVHEWVLQVVLFNTATNAQRLNALLAVSPDASAAWDLVATNADDSFIGPGYGTSAIDTTSAATLAVTIEWSAASASLNSFVKNMAILEAMGSGSITSDTRGSAPWATATPTATYKARAYCEDVPGSTQTFGVYKNGTLFDTITVTATPTYGSRGGTLGTVATSPAAGDVYSVKQTGGDATGRRYWVALERQ